MWWIGSNGSVQAAYWYEGQPWKRYELAPPGSALLNAGIKASSRIHNSMELWWSSKNGNLIDAYWYEGDKWHLFEIEPS